MQAYNIVGTDRKNQSAFKIEPRQFFRLPGSFFCSLNPFSARDIPLFSAMEFLPPSPLLGTSTLLRVPSAFSRTETLTLKHQLFRLHAFLCS